MNTLYKIKTIALKSILITLPLGGVGGGLLTSCSDFLDQRSDGVDYEPSYTTASDTIWSVLGVVNKMQAISDRTILLGEVRADLVDVNSTTSSDLRDVAMFNVGEGNVYDSPHDYYAIINNCNYFLKHVDVNMKNARNEYIFRKEYAAVKTFRAWTYLQLALNYGNVPLVTEPVMTKEESEKYYNDASNRKDITAICNYFIDDLQGLENYGTPEYGTLRGVDSRLFYIPVNVLLGDMYLWTGQYKKAAMSYYAFLNNRKGTNNGSPLGINTSHWMRSSTDWLTHSDSWTMQAFQTEKYGEELITLIPGDSIPAEGNYSQMRNTFNSTDANDNVPALGISQSMKDLSASQIYCHYTEANNVIYAPSTLEGLNKGDLRLGSAFYESNMHLSGNSKSYKYNSKHQTQSVHIYRQTLVYLRLAEALNRAGFPRFAFAILSTGVNNSVLENDVLPYYPEDEEWLRQFDFPNSRYILRTSAELATENTIGIHSIGSGWTEHNEYYTLPMSQDGTASIEGVEDLIMQEEALEFAFEGQRFYDLMRVALRRNSPAYLADRVYARRGESNKEAMKGEIKKDLYQVNNWYLKLK